MTMCFNAPSTDISAVSCIITKEGKIRNIEQAFGGVDMWCPFTLLEIVKQIGTWGDVQPAYIGSEPVNVRWFISVDNLSREYLHPAYADSDKKRREFIESKRKNAGKKR